MKRIYYLILLTLFIFNANLNSQTQSDKNEFVTSKDGTKLFVKKSGQGPVCIFIHGGPGAWSESFEKLKGNSLEEQLTMVYYDQRGCGRSEKSKTGDYSLKTMIEDIEQIRDHFHADKVYLLSHSFGGILATNYAFKYPEHVKGLILANSTLDMCSSMKAQLSYINKLLKTNFQPTDTTSGAIMSAFVEARTALTEKDLTYKVISDNKGNVDLLDKIDSEKPDNYDFAQNAFQLDDYWKDYTTLTREINVPVLIITGKKDHSVGENHYLNFNFRNKDINKINGGHLLYYENNEAFSNSIFKFVNKQK